MDIMRPILRTVLIRQGYGRQFFLKSWNPIVRAHAVVANYRTDNFTLHRLALAIHRDSIEACEVNHEVALIYGELVKTLTAAEKNIVRDEIGKEAERVNSSQFRSAVTKLLKLLGLIPKLGVVTT